MLGNFKNNFLFLKKKNLFLNHSTKQTPIFFIKKKTLSIITVKGLLVSPFSI